MGMVVGACNPSYWRGWGRRITWTWKMEVAVSQDCAIALQPGQQEWNSISKKKKKSQCFKEVYEFVLGSFQSHPGPHVACGQRVGQACSKWKHTSNHPWTHHYTLTPPGSHVGDRMELLSLSHNSAFPGPVWILSLKVGMAAETLSGHHSPNVFHLQMCYWKNRLRISSPKSSMGALCNFWGLWDFTCSSHILTKVLPISLVLWEQGLIDWSVCRAPDDDAHKLVEFLRVDSFPRWWLLINYCLRGNL